ncbi:MAG: CPBP family intramembrane metalloprotease [Melioribacteraceae bacterium]|nr:CPBP family intramembrane metalloprotease [Melioribacteraceae bacterium]
MTEDFRPSGNNHIPPFSPIAAAFLGLIGVFILYQFVGAILTLAIFGLDIENADINLMRLMTVAGQILFILLPGLWLTRYVYWDVTKVLRVKLPNIKEVAAFSVGLILITPLLQSYVYLQTELINYLAQNSDFVMSIKSALDSLDEILESTFSNLLAADNFFEGSFIILVIAVTPAICEEVFFRGYVQNSFEQKWSPLKSILVTSIFFGLYHFNPYGLLALIALGFYFGYSVYKSDSIVVPIVLHFLNNFIAVVAYFIIGDEEILSSVESEPLSDQFFSFLVLLFIFLVFVYFLRKYYHKLRD